METASKDAAQIFQTHKEGEVNKVRAQPRKSKSKIFQKKHPKGPQDKCRRCLGTHSKISCPFLNEKCFKCGKIGHTQRACRTKFSSFQGQNPQVRKSFRRGPSRQTQGGRAHFVETDPCRWCMAGDNSTTSQAALNSLFAAGPKSPDELKVTLQINRKPLEFTIDTAATVSVIPVEVYRKSFRFHVALKPSNYTLRSYSNNLVPVVGEIEVLVKHGNQELKLPLIVANGSKVSLLGRNWMKHIKLDWKQIFDVLSVEKSAGKRLQEMLKTYDCVFKQRDDQLNTSEFQSRC